MPGWQRTYVIVCTAVIGFALAYVLCDYSQWPRLAYFPYERAWRIVTVPGPVPLLYVGTILWGIGGAVSAGVLSFFATGFATKPMSERWLFLLGAWVVAGFIYAGLYYTWSLWPF